jgi:magnesium chelatase family protein
MTPAEVLKTTGIHSVAGLTGRRTAFVTTRPFRAPHHTISDVGLIGGGQVPMPGEVSLAHHGVLFLDELPEFRRHVLEVLRQPLGRESQPHHFADVIDSNVFVSLAARLTTIGGSSRG